MINKDILFPDAAHRVTVNTSEQVNAQIRQNTIARLDEIGTSFDKIEARLAELDKEWDVERVIETNASILMLTSLTLGTMVSKKFFALSFLVAGFLFQHAIQGWCPPIPVLRRMGYRTQREIDDERAVLLGRLGIQPHRSYSSEQALTAIRHDAH